MITHTTTIEIGFLGNTSKSVNVYVPFLVDEIRVIDTMYINNNVVGYNPAYSYLVSSTLFDGISIPINNPDFVNYTPLTNHSQMTIPFAYKKEVNGTYQFNLSGRSCLVYK